MKNLSILFLSGAVLTFLASSCHKHDEKEFADFGSLEVEFDNRFGSDALIFGKNYVNANGDTVNFSTLKYFVSNFVLVKDDGTEYIVPKNESYFLVDHSLASSRKLTLKNIPGGNYSEIKFVLGVDSLMSATPAEQRPRQLDPVTDAAGMYWSWNSGYIFFKLEGTSPQAPIVPAANERSILYHIGGYGGNMPGVPTPNNLKTMKLSKSGQIAPVGKLDAESGHDHDPADSGLVPHAHVVVDINEFFGNPVIIDVATHPIFHWGEYSVTIANNYADMFSLDHIHQ
jgi:hypothetical protein